jgi:hypothetical protein
MIAYSYEQPKNKEQPQCEYQITQHLNKAEKMEVQILQVVPYGLLEARKKDVCHLGKYNG